MVRWHCGRMAIWSAILHLGQVDGMRPELALMHINGRWLKSAPYGPKDSYFVDCQMTPWMCEAPFDCVEANKNVSNLWRTRWKVATPEGSSNPHSWCVDDTYWKSTVKECLVNKNPKKAALAKLSTVLSKGADDDDAKWCFLEKLCNIESITENTTAEEGQDMCTFRYGDRWKHTGLQDFYTGLRHDPHNYTYVFGEAGHWHSFRQASAKSRISCAQGSFHCDVVYCKETYCKDPVFMSRYSQYLKWSTENWKVQQAKNSYSPAYMEAEEAKQRKEHMTFDE